MRFKKGDKVEVRNNKGVPYLWRPAEIQYRSDHTYHVQYDYYPAMETDQLVEIVPRKLVRPLPPLLQHDLESYDAGDVVEVFLKSSWMVAVILKILGGKKEHKKVGKQVSRLQNRYLVRLLGSSEELVIDRMNIRMRQTWHGIEWIIMGKSSKAGNDIMSSKPSTSDCCKIRNFQVPPYNSRLKDQLANDCVNIQDNGTLGKSPLVSTRSLKRASPYGSSIVEVPDGHVQKLRAIEKEGQKKRVIAASDREKVDAVAYPALGEKHMHASFNIISNGYNQAERAKQNDIVGHSLIRNIELNSSESGASSVGSCSITNQNLKTCSSHFIPRNCKDSETLSSDAESSNCPGFGGQSPSNPLKEDAEVAIRRLELYAYRSTMEALFASGPLSWDQEVLLTNLRIVLHISNDEHLKELKHLISTKTSISVK